MNPKKEKPQLFHVSITRAEFLKLPMETRRRILRQQTKEFIEASKAAEFQDAMDCEEDP